MYVLISMNHLEQCTNVISVVLTVRFASLDDWLMHILVISFSLCYSNCKQGWEIKQACVFIGWKTKNSFPSNDGD